MPRITGLIHVRNDERQVGRALMSLRPCDEVLVVDHGSKDGTLRVAREHGARIIPSAGGADGGSYAQKASYEWILCLLPYEAVAEDLEASLLEWKASAADDDRIGYNIGIRKQVGTQWRVLEPEMRLVNWKKTNWIKDLPAPAAGASILAGYILRIPNEER